MGTGQGVQQYINLRDFTGGIASYRHSLDTGQPAPEDSEAGSVMAQESDTYGCYGHPAGGLHPLPGAIIEIKDPGQDWPEDPLPGVAITGESPKDAHPNYTGRKSLVVNATALIQAAPRPDPDGETINASNWRKNTTVTPDQFHVLYGGYGMAVDGTVSQYWQGTNEWRVWNMTRFPYATTLLLGGHLADEDDEDSLGVRLPLVTTSLTERGFDDPDIWGEDFMSLGMTSANLLVTTSGTYESDSAGAQMAGTILNIGRTAVVAMTTRVGMWPRIIGKAFNGADEDEDLIESFIIDQSSNTAPRPGSPIRQSVVHQGRLVFTVQSRNGEATAQGIGALARIAPGDNICFYPANDLYSDPATNVYRIMPENPGPIGVMASMNANELVIIKHQGGGGLLRGDVVAPQFISLPGMPSIQGATNIPVVTTMGLVFGTRDGVYVWQGSEGAQPISAQLDGWFWQPEGTPGLEDGFLYEEYPHRGKFNVSGHFVFVPNNWVYDQRSGGWFRLNPPTRVVEGEGEDPDTTYKVGYRNYEVSTTGRVYAVKPIVTEDDLTVAHVYDRDIPAPEFSWHSHPIARTIARRTDVREVVIVAQGLGEVSVEVIGIDGQADKVTFTVASPDRPKIFTKPVKVLSEDIEVIIQSRTDEPIVYTDDGVPLAMEGFPAPSVYRVGLGIAQGPTVRRTGTLERTPSTEVGP